MKKKTILLVNDLPGIGKVALGAMVPILSYLGYSIHNLPTALVSNTLDYGKFHILDTTDHMRETIQVWKDLGFTMDAIATGFISNPAQIPLIQDLIGYHKEKPYIMVDPIMGDHGSMYNGLSEDLIPLMRQMVAQADLVVPNITEAFLLKEGRGKTQVETEEELRDLGQSLRDLGAKSYLITSVYLYGQDMVYGYDHKEDREFSFTYTKLPVTYPGTGDIFSAVLLGQVLKGKGLEEAAMEASRFIYQAILANREDTTDTYEGLFVERHFHLLEGE